MILECDEIVWNGKDEIPKNADVIIDLVLQDSKIVGFYHNENDKNAKIL